MGIRVDISIYNVAKLHDNNAKLLKVDAPKGFGFGIGAGLIYPITDSMEMETGIRYVKSGMKDSQTYSNGDSVKTELKHYTQYYLGVNYRF